MILKAARLEFKKTLIQKEAINLLSGHQKHTALYGGS